VRKIQIVAFGVLAVLLGPSGGAQTVQTVPYDHIHLAASDPEKAYEWYVANLGGQVGENPGRVIFEPFANARPLPVQMIFIKAPADLPPSEGGVIDSVGFSFPDVGAKATALAAAGATIVQPARDVAGMKQAVVRDPWGVKITLVEDRARPGFHHIALRVADPEATTQWFLSSFGGERVKVAGAPSALRYDKTYLLIQQGQGTLPSQGRAIDHLGFAPAKMDAVATELDTKQVKFTSRPQPKPNQFGHRTAYVEAPGGVRIELVEHAQCAWGKT
jgi:catechol 2,3-dioxygenase-like lactoylglutathione lyase family enzyme